MTVLNSEVHPMEDPEGQLERALIEEATAAITGKEGKPPSGWMTPLQAESVVTPGAEPAETRVKLNVAIE